MQKECDKMSLYDERLLPCEGEDTLEKIKEGVGRFIREKGGSYHRIRYRLQ